MNRMTIEKTKLKESIYRDIQTEILNFYSREGIEYKVKGENTEDIIVDFFSYLYKLLPIKKRKVFYSKELLGRIESDDISEEHVKILKKYENAFLEGINMNGFLSNNTEEPKKPDFLLYTWHLYHLHMSGKFVDSIEQKKNNRSDTQLLCIINEDAVYFIDVIEHPTKPDEYFNIQKLRIIVDNGWIEKIGFREIEDMIPGSLEPKISESADIFKLYSQCSCNCGFEFDEKGYMPTISMTGARRPISSSEKLIKINSNIRKIEHIQENYKGFLLGCKENGKYFGYAVFKTSSGHNQYIDIFDGIKF